MKERQLRESKEGKQANELIRGKAARRGKTTEDRQDGEIFRGRRYRKVRRRGRNIY